MRSQRLPLLALPALAALLAGCGGGSGHAQALSATPTGSATVTPTTATSSPVATVTTTATATTAPTTPASTPPPAGAAACRTAALTLSTGRPDGAAGHTYLPLRFTNKGPSSCLLAGFPGVSYAAGADHHQVGKAADRDTSRPVVPITLTPGATTTATVTQTDVGVYGASQCKPTRVDALQVFPPGETHAALVPLPNGEMGCANPAVAVLRIAPVGS